MSRIGNNPLLKGLHGMLAKLIVFREVRGRMVVSNRPKRSGKLTPHQEMMRSRFQRAVQYAKQQMQKEQRKAEYAAAIDDRRHSAYAVALTDCMTAPKVNAVDTSHYKGIVGNPIFIRATDDFKVTDVQVTITDSNGNVIEQGNAVLLPNASDEWLYVITQTNTMFSGTRIIARAMDYPGNVGVMETVVPE
jgi:hypothetical protein